MLNIISILLCLILFIVPKTESAQGVVRQLTTCNSTTIHIRLELKEEFYGRIYAKGFHFEKRCGEYGPWINFASLDLNMDSCGVTFSKANVENYTISVWVVLQADKYLRRKSDIEYHAECVYHYDPETVLINTIRRDMRIKRQDANSTVINKVTTIRSWMEISGYSNKKKELAIGEDARMIVRSYVPVGFDVRIANCTAHDGTNAVTEHLIDSSGCPIDNTLISPFKILRKKPMLTSYAYWSNSETGRDDSDALASHESQLKPFKRQETFGLIPRDFAADFKAFQFPDSSVLHITCSVQICINNCSQTHCHANGTTNSLKLPDDVMFTTNVFNSIKILPLDYDLEENKVTYEAFKNKRNKYTDKVCMEPLQTAFVLSVMGSLFLFILLGVFYVTARRGARSCFGYEKTKEERSILNCR